MTESAGNGALTLWEEADRAVSALRQYLFDYHRVDPQGSTIKAIRLPEGNIGLRVEIDPNCERHAEILPKIFEGFIVRYEPWGGVSGVIHAPGAIGRR